MRTKESWPSTAEAIMAALTVPHKLDAETPQYANVIDGLHAIAGAIDRLTEVIWRPVEAQDRQADRIERAIDRTAGIGPIDIGFDDET
jgi:hypothetical protein